MSELSFRISYKIAKQGKCFSNGEFVKECLSEVAAFICPEQTENFNSICLSRRTVVRRIKDLSDHINVKLIDVIKSFKYFSLALDESCDISDTSELLIFIRGITEDFQIVEQLASMQPMKGKFSYYS